jgi:hypothetical protein
MGRMAHSFKITAAFLAIIFTWTTISLSAPPVYTIKVSENAGRVSQRYKGRTTRTIIHIQDAHSNMSAQKNIAHIINELIPHIKPTLPGHAAPEVFRAGREKKNEDSLNIPFVGIEGAMGSYDLKTLRDFPLADVKERVATDYVRDGKFIGAELASVISPNDFTLFGLEDETLFARDFALFYNVQHEKEKIVTLFSSIAESLEALKEVIYSDALTLFDTEEKEYHEGSLDLFSFLDILAARSESAPIDLLQFPNLSQMRELLVMNQTLDNATLKKETGLMREFVAGAAGCRENLAEIESALFRGERSEDEYLSFLVNSALKEGTSLESFPTVRKKIECMKRNGLINVPLLLREVEELSTLIKVSLARSDRERELITLEERFSLVRDFYTLQAERDQCELIFKNQDEYTLTALTRDVARLGERNGIKKECVLPLLIDEARLFADVKEFYTIAEARDVAMLKNLENAMAAHGQDIGVIVAGGYHSAGIVKELEASGTSFITITPVIDTSAQEVSYLDRMLGRISSCESFLTSHVQISRINAALRTLNQIGFAEILNNAEYEMYGHTLIDPESGRVLDTSRVDDLVRELEELETEASRDIAEVLKVIKRDESAQALTSGASVSEVLQRAGMEVKGRVHLEHFVDQLEERLTGLFYGETKSDLPEPVRREQESYESPRLEIKERNTLHAIDTKRFHELESEIADANLRIENIMNHLLKSEDTRALLGVPLGETVTVTYWNYGNAKHLFKMETRGSVYAVALKRLTPEADEYYFFNKEERIIFEDNNGKREIPDLYSVLHLERDSEGRYARVTREEPRNPREYDSIALLEFKEGVTENIFDPEGEDFALSEKKLETVLSVLLQHAQKSKIDLIREGDRALNIDFDVARRNFLVTEKDDSLEVVWVDPVWPVRQDRHLSLMQYLLYMYHLDFAGKTDGLSRFSRVLYEGFPEYTEYWDFIFNTILDRLIDFDIEEGGSVEEIIRSSEKMAKERERVRWQVLNEKMRESSLQLGTLFTKIVLRDNVLGERDRKTWDALRRFLDESDWLSAARFVKNEEGLFTRIQDEYKNRIKSDESPREGLKMMRHLFAFLRELNEFSEKYESDKNFKKNIYRYFVAGVCPVYLDIKTDEYYTPRTIAELKQIHILNTIFASRDTTDRGVPFISMQQNYGALYAWNVQATRATGARKKQVLVHFSAFHNLAADTVPDITKFREIATPEEWAKYATQANTDGYIVPAMSEGLIDEMIWVVPELLGGDLIGKSIEFKVNLSADGKTFVTESRAPELKGQQLNPYNAGDTSRERVIIIHVVRGDDYARLAELTRGDSDVLLNIDATFFGLTDPEDGALFTPDENEKGKLFDVLRAFYAERADRVSMVTLARSPGFVAEETERDARLRVRSIFGVEKEMVRNKRKADSHMSEVSSRKNLSSAELHLFSHKVKDILRNPAEAGLISNQAEILLNEKKSVSLIIDDKKITAYEYAMMRDSSRERGVTVIPFSEWNAERASIEKDTILLFAGITPGECPEVESLVHAKVFLGDDIDIRTLFVGYFGLILSALIVKSREERSDSLVRLDGENGLFQNVKQFVFDNEILIEAIRNEMLTRLVKVSA